MSVEVGGFPKIRQGMLPHVICVQLWCLAVAWSVDGCSGHGRGRRRLTDSRGGLTDVTHTKSAFIGPESTSKKDRGGARTRSALRAEPIDYKSDATPLGHVCCDPKPAYGLRICPPPSLPPGAHPRRASRHQETAGRWWTAKSRALVRHPLGLAGGPWPIPRLLLISGKCLNLIPAAKANVTT